MSVRHSLAHRWHIVGTLVMPCGYTAVWAVTDAHVRELRAACATLLQQRHQLVAGRARPCAVHGALTRQACAVLLPHAPSGLQNVLEVVNAGVKAPQACVGQAFAARRVCRVDVLVRAPTKRANAAGRARVRWVCRQTIARNTPVKPLLACRAVGPAVVAYRVAVAAAMLLAPV